MITTFVGAIAHTLSKAGSLWQKEGAFVGGGTQRLKEVGDFPFPRPLPTVGHPESQKPWQPFK